MEPAKSTHEMLHGYYFEDLREGMRDVYAKTITDGDVMSFAGISGDTNPIHLNHEFASETMFEGRVAHGMLTASLISTVIGTKLPGPGCVYVGQNLRFKAPVKIGDTVTARCAPVHVGRSTVVLQVTLTRGDGKIVGSTSQTHLFLGWKD